MKTNPVFFNSIRQLGSRKHAVMRQKDDFISSNCAFTAYHRSVIIKSTHCDEVKSGISLLTATACNHCAFTRRAEGNNNRRYYPPDPPHCAKKGRLSWLASIVFTRSEAQSVNITASGGNFRPRFPCLWTDKHSEISIAPDDSLKAGSGMDTE